MRLNMEIAQAKEIKAHPILPDDTCARDDLSIINTAR